MNRYTILRLDGDAWRRVDSYTNARGAADDFLGRVGSDIDPDWIASDLRVGCTFERVGSDGTTYVVTGAPVEEGAVYDGRRVA